ncbi:DUF4145 domain-containing protein [Tianweitania sp.]|uniref:DUF4145 domain-containing protein n=1 Tax=Tianweitania sp. TaxID=2021634 RepID=UPI00289A9252|nr:DUF4145 domain-containing protein [Tianweitania sp.]
MSDSQKSSETNGRKAFCSACGGDRNCTVRGEFLQAGGDEDFQWHTYWYILECRGCDHTFVQTVSTDSESIEYDYGPDGETISWARETSLYWPAKAKRKKPDWLSEIVLEDVDVTVLDQSLVELYGALDNDLIVLAGIGIRTTFDIASKLLGVDPDLTFKKKLAALMDANHIGPSDISHLETLVDAGSASAHRGWRPGPAALSTMMDVLEHFLQNAFIEPHRKKQRDEAVRKLKVPRRKPQGKNNENKQVLLVTGIDDLGI